MNEQEPVAQLTQWYDANQNFHRQFELLKTDWVGTAYMYEKQPPKPEEFEEVRGLVEALEIIVGQKPCVDSLMSDRDIAKSALEAYKEATK